MRYIKAHKSRLHGKRNKKSIKYIVIHYTEGVGDTAEGNCKYFSRLDNPKLTTGAHFFVDHLGECIKSIPMNQIAYAVGGEYNADVAKYYKKCTNANSVSIEIANLVNGDLKAGHYIGLKKAIKYIKKYCPNAKTIIRHWDVNGKTCPYGMTGKNNAKWESLRKELYKMLEGE